MSDTLDYLQYAHKVLGLTSFIAPHGDSLDEGLAQFARTSTGHWPAPAEFDLLIIHEGEGLFHGETQELWEKMRSAMNLSATRVLEVEIDKPDIEGALLELLQSYPAAVALLLLAEPTRMDGSRTLGIAKVIESYRPELLLKNPDLKRSAWRDLQLVMAEI